MLLGMNLSILLEENLENKTESNKDDAKKKEVISSTTSIKLIKLNK